MRVGEPFHEVRLGPGLTPTLTTGAYIRPARPASKRSGHLSQCVTPKHHALLQPKLPDPCGLGGPRVGGMATLPLPSRGSPTRGQKMGKKGDNRGERGEALPGAPTYPHCDDAPTANNVVTLGVARRAILPHPMGTYLCQDKRLQTSPAKAFGPSLSDTPSGILPFVGCLKGPWTVPRSECVGSSLSGRPVRAASFVGARGPVSGLLRVWQVMRGSSCAAFPTSPWSVVRSSLHEACRGTSPPPGMHCKGGGDSSDPSLCPATVSLTAASMAFVTDSNRPQPLWQPAPTACLTASGAGSEARSLLMHPCPLLPRPRPCANPRLPPQKLGTGSVRATPPLTALHSRWDSC